MCHPCAAILAANGADLNAETKAGYTPLHVACHFGAVNMVRFLLESEVNVDVQVRPHFSIKPLGAPKGEVGPRM
jgi:ankyrin